jgi:MerR family redox-sensitive transcriptional activator SoxR
MPRIDVQLPLTAGEVAARSGAAVSALHFWERRGLIQSFRSEGNQRRYRRDVLRRVALIRVAQSAGVPLSEIEAALATIPHGRQASAADWARLSRSWRDRLQARIDLLERLKGQLTDCIGCGCLSVSKCPLRNPGDTMAAKGPGPVLLLRPGCE